MQQTEQPSDWTAPEGQEWVCVCCGRHGPQRDRIGDESCFLNAQLFPTGLLRFDGHQRVQRIVEKAGDL